MGRFLAVLGLALCLATAALPAAARKKPNPAALALFRKAIEGSNVEAKNGTPFRLQAKVRVFSIGGKEADGMVIEFWASGDKTRTETMFTGYSSVEVRSGKRIWEKSSTEYTPYPVTVIWHALQFESDLQSVVRRAVDAPSSKLAPKQRKEERLDLGKPKREKGKSWKCVQVKGKFSPKERYCFDSASSLLTEVHDGNVGMRYDYGDYAAFGTRTFPRNIRVSYDDGTQLANIRITRIDPLGNPGPALFLPVPGSQEEGGSAAGCKKTKSPGGKVKAATLLKRVMPIYPIEAKRKGIDGRVLIHAVIGKDGAPHVLWVVKSPAPILAEAALAAVRQWRYRPTLLCGKPVRVDTVITVIFNLH